MAACLSSPFFRSPSAQTLIFRSCHGVLARQALTHRGTWRQGASIPHGDHYNWCMSLRFVRQASSTISEEQEGQNTTGTVSKKAGRPRRKKTEEQAQPHPPRVAKELEESERLSGARKGTMRETVGKGKVQLVPIAILPNKHETPPPQHFQLGTKIRADYETICKTRRLKGKRVFTNENFVTDSFESQTLDSWAGPGEVEALTSNADPGLRKLVRYLVSEVGVAKKSAEQYLNSAPSILGTSVEQLRGVVKDLEVLGFSRGQVGQILPQFPCSVAMDWGNLREVFVFLNEEVRMAEAQVLSLLKRHPFIFTLPCSQVRQCLSKLQNLNLNSREIANILNHTPLLACVPLSDQSVDTIETFLLYCMNTSSVQPMLFHTIFHHPSHVQLTGHTSLLTALLHTYQADPQKVLSKLPLFFQQDADQLEMVIKVLCGSPLYFDRADIATLLETVPGVLCSIADKKLFRKHLSELCKLFTSPVSARLKIRKYADLLNPECSVKTKYRALTKLGFSFTQAASVLCERPSLLTQHLQQEFVPRLKLLMGVAGVDPTYLAETTSLFSIPLDVLQARLKFAAAHQPKLLVAEKLSDLLCSSHDTFADMCGCSVELYHAETQLDRKAKVRTIGRKKRTATKSSVQPTSPISSPPSPELGPEADNLPLSLPWTQEPLTSDQPPSPPLLQAQPPGVASPSLPHPSPPSLVGEVPTEVTDQVLDSGVLLSSLDKEEDLSPSDVEVEGHDLPTLDEDEGEMEGEESEEGVNLDGYIAAQLEELMGKLSEASSVQYRLSSCNMVLSDSPPDPYPQELMLYEDIIQQGTSGDPFHAPALRP